MEIDFSKLNIPTEKHLIRLNLAKRQPRVLLIADASRTPGAWFLSLFQQMQCKLLHVGIGSLQYDITNWKTVIQSNKNELGPSQCNIREFDLYELLHQVGTDYDFIFHVQDYSYPTNIDRSPIPYIFYCTEAVLPRAPRCAWLVLVATVMIKEMMLRDWPTCPNVIYTPYSIAYSLPPYKYPPNKRKYKVSFSGELYGLECYKERREVIPYLQKELGADFNCHYMFPIGYISYTKWTELPPDKITVEIEPGVSLDFFNSEIVRSVDDKTIGIHIELILRTITSYLANIKFKTKTTTDKIKLFEATRIRLMKRYTENMARSPAAGKGILDITEYPLMNIESEICVNIPTAAGFNFRDIEICLGGAMLLTKRTLDHDLLGFEDGVNCRYFDTKEEALHIIQHEYDPEIAKRGFELVTSGRIFWRHQNYTHVYFTPATTSQPNDSKENYTKILFVSRNPSQFIPESDVITKNGGKIIITKEKTIEFMIPDSCIDKTMEELGFTSWSVDPCTMLGRMKSIMVAIKNLTGVNLKYGVSELNKV